MEQFRHTDIKRKADHAVYVHANLYTAATYIATKHIQKPLQT